MISERLDLESNFVDRVILVDVELLTQLVPAEEVEDVCPPEVVRLRRPIILISARPTPETPPLPLILTFHFSLSIGYPRCGPFSMRHINILSSFRGVR
jgi:hypothetical protein